MLADNEFDAYKTALDSGKDADAARIKKEFDAWRNTLTAEYGRSDADAIAKRFDDAEKAAVARKQEEARKLAEEKKKQEEAVAR